MEKEIFKTLKQKYGRYSSFTIWKLNDSDNKVGDISLFDGPIENELNDKYVFIALNPAKRPATESGNEAVLFKNFHSDYPYQKDYKLAFALQGTILWGSYITDLYKSFAETQSERLDEHIKKHPTLAETDKKVLKDELDILINHSPRVPTLIALGRKTEKHLKKLFKDEYLSIIYVTHYSHRIGKVAYREKVRQQLAGVLGDIKR